MVTEQAKTLKNWLKEIGIESPKVRTEIRRFKEHGVVYREYGNASAVVKAADLADGKEQALKAKSEFIKFFTCEGWTLITY